MLAKNSNKTNPLFYQRFLLLQIKGVRLTICLLSLGLVVLVFSLAIAVEVKCPPGIIFSHQVHDSVGIACNVCHAEADTSSKGSHRLLPAKSTCNECHDVEDDENCSLCHSDPAAPRSLEPVTDYSPKFNHAAHASNGIGCLICHAEINSPDSSTSQGLPPMEPCMGCHDGETAERSCIVCHEEPEGKYPADHVPKEWIIDHVFEYSVDLGESCKMCHTNSQCQRCRPDRAILSP